MSRSTIIRKREKLLKLRDFISAEISSLQETCPHAAPTMKFQGSSGNYDPSSDCYWISWYCLDCQKHWTTPQGNEHTSKYPGAVKVMT